MHYCLLLGSARPQLLPDHSHSHCSDCCTLLLQSMSAQNGLERMKTPSPHVLKMFLLKSGKEQSKVFPLKVLKENSFIFLSPLTYSWFVRVRLWLSEKQPAWCNHQKCGPFALLLTELLYDLLWMKPFPQNINRLKIHFFKLDFILFPRDFLYISLSAVFIQIVGGKKIKKIQPQSWECCTLQVLRAGRAVCPSPRTASNTFRKKRLHQAWGWQKQIYLITTFVPQDLLNPQWSSQRESALHHCEHVACACWSPAS